jgi:putative membrane protein
MSRLKNFIKQLHWKIILIRILVNGIVLTLIVAILPDIYFATPTLKSVLIVAVGLGILNAIVKPVILLLTGQFIFATFGILVILVNTLILYLLEWLFPNILVIDNFWWALLGSAILSLLGNALENLFGLTPPIVSEEQAEIRRRIEADQQVSLVNLVTRPQPVVSQAGETQSMTEVAAARAVLDSLKVASAPAEAQPASEAPQSSTPESPGSIQDEPAVDHTDAVEVDKPDIPDTTVAGGAA